MKNHVKRPAEQENNRTQKILADKIVSPGMSQSAAPKTKVHRTLVMPKLVSPALKAKPFPAAKFLAY